MHLGIIDMHSMYSILNGIDAIKKLMNIIKITLLEGIETLLFCENIIKSIHTN